MTGLDRWLKQATRQLSRDSAAQVRAEIQEHYEAAREAAVSGGASAEDAEEQAVRELGDAHAANCLYRRVLLTTGEAMLLSEGNWEARAVCSRPWLKWTLLTAAGAAFYVTAALFLKGRIPGAWVLMAGGAGLLFAAPFLPVYTPARSRVFRLVRWVAMMALLAMVFGGDGMKAPWLLFSCAWPMAWVEWTRSSIRRKLPVTQWPKQLYL